MLEPLDERRRDRLVAAMEEVERLLAASAIAIAVEDPATATMRAGASSSTSRSWPAASRPGFDPALSIPADARRAHASGRPAARRAPGERPLGCGALKFHGDEPTELKRMWVAPEARGVGLGRRLLRELERRARGAGATVLRLETNGALREAIGLYREAGYREVDAFNDEPYAHHWFEKRLEEFE